MTLSLNKKVKIDSFNFMGRNNYLIESYILMKTATTRKTTEDQNITVNSNSNKTSQDIINKSRYKSEVFQLISRPIFKKKVRENAQINTIVTRL